MTTWVKIIGALMIIEGIVAALTPGVFRAAFQKIADSWLVHIVAAFYAVIGMILLLAATKCTYPPLIITIGILCSLLAITMFAVHNSHLSLFFSWFSRRRDITVRILAILEATLGIWVIFAT